ncbi:major intrinsic protein [Ditylenchus destructor]|nr:major intrinsic protein [Ditylenchus destructor]
MATPNEFDIYGPPANQRANYYGTYPGKNKGKRSDTRPPNGAPHNGEFPLLHESSQQNSILNGSLMDWPSPGLPPTPVVANGGVRNGFMRRKDFGDGFYVSTPNRPRRFDESSYRSFGQRRMDYSQVNLGGNSSVKNEPIEQSEPTTTQKLKSTCAHIFRPILAELVVVFLCTIIHLRVKQSLEIRFPNAAKIILLSLTDGILVLSFVSVLRTVHINPVVTVANLFVTTSKWYLCPFILLSQLIGATVAVFLNSVVHNSETIFDMESELRPLLAIDDLQAVCQVMFNQFLGTIPVILCHIHFTTLLNGVFRAEPSIFRVIGLSAAVSLNTFLGLLTSPLSWNSPLMTLALTIQKLVLSLLPRSANRWFNAGKDGSVSQNMNWHNQYIFWLGPLLGALVACILYRVAVGSRIAHQASRKLSPTRKNFSGSNS